MKRDFTENYKEELIGLIRNCEENKWKDCKDWIGERLLDYSDLIGILGLHKAKSDVDKYTSVLSDKNNADTQKIEQIFTNVNDVCKSYGERIWTIWSNIIEFQTQLQNLSYMIGPITGINISNGTKYLLKLEEISDCFSSIDTVSDEEKEKVIKAFEEEYPGYGWAMDRLTASGNPNVLTADDIRNIKYIAYTAEEPYRTIYLANAWKYSLERVSYQGENSQYSSSTNLVRIEKVHELLTNNPRGAYVTWFHEGGHASDYMQDGYDGYVSREYTTYSEVMGREITLQDAIYYDVYNNIEEQIRACGAASEENVQRIIESFKYGNGIDGLSTYEIDIRDKVIDAYSDNLQGVVNGAASDVYGGVTNLIISGTYGHTPDEKSTEEYTYWYVDGQATKKQSTELWAHYFSFGMTGEEASLESLRNYFPEASKVLDEIAIHMKEEIDEE